MNMISKIVQPDSGKIYINGINQDAPDCESYLAVCLQTDALWKNLTVMDHLDLWGRIRGISQAEIPHFCSFFARSLELEDHLQKKGSF